jgi:hypothetical protein
MAAVKTELCNCYLVHIYVCPPLIISQKFEEFGLKKVEFVLDHNHWISLLILKGDICETHWC